ncbi:hypothetical protein BDW02DRAFT_341096 [Decorospora gaudefroyi]|uniref:Uncharacterized protein n=1 Tax=Decorospora gaudefroyi TaxID=184978 RepID=A0A6A5KDN3_9PLEO|nr:hypothetical protein BDW02DRAFT_341096 [Decorospora gaudefroyi]
MSRRTCELVAMVRFPCHWKHQRRSTSDILHPQPTGCPSFTEKWRSRPRKWHDTAGSSPPNMTGITKTGDWSLLPSTSLAPSQKAGPTCHLLCEDGLKERTGAVFTCKFPSEYKARPSWLSVQTWPISCVSRTLAQLRTRQRNRLAYTLSVCDFSPVPVGDTRDIQPSPWLACLLHHSQICSKTWQSIQTLGDRHLFSSL